MCDKIRYLCINIDPSDLSAFVFGAVCVADDIGLFTPVGALALTGTMTVAAYQHILTAGLNIYVLELVVLYLGGSLALLLVGPGRFSFDAGMLPGLLVKPTVRVKPEISAPSEGISGLTPAYVQINASNSTR